MHRVHHIYFTTMAYLHQQYTHSQFMQQWPACHD